MPAKSLPQETSAQDAARYGQRLREIGHHLEVLPGEDAARARLLLAQAADAATEAAGLMGAVKPTKLRLHLNTAAQPSLIVEAIRFILESSPGETPVTFHQGASQQSLPFAVHVSARLVGRLRALLGDESVWTEVRK